jgi:hypothetical protein
VLSRRAPRAGHTGSTFVFYEAYFSNFIEGTEFTLQEAQDIVFGGEIPDDRPADAHDVLEMLDSDGVTTAFGSHARNRAATASRLVRSGQVVFIDHGGRRLSVAIKVGGVGAGKLTVTGHGIKKTRKTISKSTVATITAKRTKGKPGKVTVSFDPTGPARPHKATK